MTDILEMTKESLYLSDYLHQRIFDHFLTARDKKKLEEGKKIQFRFKLDKITPMKTLKQLGYLEAEVYFKALVSYMISEGRKMEQEEAKGLLKRDCGFTYKGGTIMSMADADIEKASRFIEKAVTWINEDMGFVTCDDSETWKLRKRKKMYSSNEV